MKWKDMNNGDKIAVVITTLMMIGILLSLLCKVIKHPERPMMEKPDVENK